MESQVTTQQAYTVFQKLQNAFFNVQNDFT